MEFIAADGTQKTGEECGACGGPLHAPTWGCVKPRPAE